MWAMLICCCKIYVSCVFDPCRVFFHGVVMSYVSHMGGHNGNRPLGLFVVLMVGTVPSLYVTSNNKSRSITKYKFINTGFVAGLVLH